MLKTLWKLLKTKIISAEWAIVKKLTAPTYGGARSITKVQILYHQIIKIVPANLEERRKSNGKTTDGNSHNHSN